MAAKHKNQHAGLKVRTSVPAGSVAEMARSTGELVKSSIPGRPFVRFEGSAPGRLLFSVRSMGGHMELMCFHLDVREAEGASHAETGIDGFKTTQSTVMFIPVGPKTLVGYPEYKRFNAKLLEGLRAQDPSASGTFVERPNG